MIPSCEPPEPPPELFEMVEPGAPLVLDLREVDEALLAGVEELGVHATLVLTLEEAPSGVEPALRGHELALDMRVPDEAEDWSKEDWWDEGRKQLRAYKRLTGTRPDTVRVESLPRPAERAMTQLGLRTVLVDSPGRAHLAVKEDGTRSTTLILPLQEYQCAELTGWALDRVGEASEDALMRGLPAVRVVVDGQPTEVLTRWLDRAFLRQRGVVLRADAIPHAMPDPNARPERTGRRTDRSKLMLAAEALSEGGRLPRSAGGLSLTEAFLGFCLLLIEDVEEVLIGPLGPPSMQAASSHPGQVSADEVRATAARLAPTLSGAVPGFLDVGDKTLTASEFLVVMARLLLDPTRESVEVPKVESPDPFAAGLGWGLSEG